MKRSARWRQERTAALVNQFRREFEHAGDDITRGVDTIASSDAMQRTVTELANGGEYANYVNEAAYQRGGAAAGFS